MPEVNTWLTPARSQRDTRIDDRPPGLDAIQGRPREPFVRPEVLESLGQIRVAAHRRLRPEGRLEALPLAQRERHALRERHAREVGVGAVLDRKEGQLRIAVKPRCVERHEGDLVVVGDGRERLRGIAVEPGRDDQILFEQDDDAVRSHPFAARPEVTDQAEVTRLDDHLQRAGGPGDSSGRRQHLSRSRSPRVDRDDERDDLPRRIVGGLDGVQ